MDALDGLLSKLVKQVQTELVESSARARSADAQRAFNKILSTEDAKLRALFDRREAERKAKLDAALKELEEAEGACVVRARPGRAPGPGPGARGGGGRCARCARAFSSRTAPRPHETARAAPSQPHPAVQAPSSRRTRTRRASWAPSWAP